MILALVYQMKLLTYIFIVIPVLLFAQSNPVEQDSTAVEYYYIDGDSIPVATIDLDAVVVLNRLKFDDKAARIRYLILKRKTIKVYPYAKLAAERLVELTNRLETLDATVRNVNMRKLSKNILKKSFRLN